MKATYSFSKLEMFEKCPLAYKKVYLDKIPRAESEALTTGKQCHGVIAGYLEHLIQHSLVTDWEWSSLAKDANPDVLQIWERFRSSFVLPPMEDPRVEMRLAFTRSWQPTEFFGPEAYFRMVVDWAFRQGDLGIIRDWKTNKLVPETVEKNLQLRIYGWGARKAIFPGVQEILLQLHFLRFGAEREILLTPGDLDTVPQELEAKIAVIEAEKHFNPTPGSFCGWCGVTAHCPIMAQALVPANVLYPVNHEDAVKAAILLLAIQTMDKTIKDHLKKYVQEFGPVQVGDQVYGPSTSTTYDLDPRGVTEHLLGEGLEVDQLWNLLNLTKTSLERGLKKFKRKDLLDAILAAAPSKDVEKIGFHKIKEA